MKLFSAIIVMGLSVLVHAQTEPAVVFRSAVVAQKAFLISENNIWKLKINSYQNGWPEQLAEYQFKTSSSARRYLSSHQFLLDASLIEANTEKELRGDSSEMIWTPKNTWNWDWEVKFSEWIKNEVDTDFYVKYKLKTDCADVMYSLRWIFARINYLPAANKTMDGVWFTHRSLKNEWKDLKTNSEWFKDQRFMTALKFIMQQTYTHTLHKDSYPIALKAEAMLPGAFHLIVSGKSGHTMVIYRQTPATDGVRVMIMASTIPRDIRVLSEHMIYPTKFDPNSDSIRRMRWPLINGSQISLVPPEKMPFYSLEQFNGNEVNVNRILNPNPNWEQEYNQALSSVKELLEQRRKAVDEGFKACAPNKCPAASSLYDQYSTPSRDKRLHAALNYFDMEISSLYDEYYSRASTEPVFTLFDESFTLNQIRQVVSSEYFSSNPNDNLARRWLLGKNHFGDVYTEEFQKSLIARRTALDKAIKECRQIESCEPSSELSKQIDLDNVTYKITSIYVALVEYYKNKNDVVHLNEFQKNIFSDGRQQLNPEEWQKLAGRSASDPRTEPSMLEGRWDDLYLTYNFKPEESLIKIVKNFVLTSNSNQDDKMHLSRILVKNGKIVLEPMIFCNPNGQIESENLDRDWVVVQCGDELKKININTGEVILHFSKDLVKEAKSYFAGDKLVVYNSEMVKVPYDHEVMKDIKIYNLLTEQLIFETEPQVRVMSFQVSVKSNLAGLQVIKDYVGQDITLEYRNYDLSLPTKPYRVLKNLLLSSDVDFWFYNQNQDVFLSERFVSYSVGDDQFSSLTVLVKSKKDNFKYITLEQKERNYLIYETQINPAQATVTNKILMTLVVDEYGLISHENNRGVLISAKNNQAIVITENESGFNISKTESTSVLWSVDDHCSLKISVDGDKIQSHIYNSEGAFVATVSGLAYDVKPDFLYPNQFWFTISYGSTNYIHGPQNTRFPRQVVVGSYRYNLNGYGILAFDRQALLILK